MEPGALRGRPDAREIRRECGLDGDRDEGALPRTYARRPDGLAGKRIDKIKVNRPKRVESRIEPHRDTEITEKHGVTTEDGEHRKEITRETRGRRVLSGEKEFLVSASLW